MLLRVAGLALVAGPPVAVVAMAVGVTYDGGRVTCGSALSSSLERASPGHVLDRYQSGCQAAGERVVDAATSYGAASVVVAAGLALGALVPPGGRRVAAA